MVRFCWVLIMLSLAFNIHAQSCGFTCNAEQEEAANAQLNTYILATQSNLGLSQNSTCSNNTQGDVKLPVVFHLIYIKFLGT